MNTKDLEQHYGSRKAAMEALPINLTREAWRKWGQRGMPPWWQLIYSLVSNGALKIDEAHLREKQ